MNQRFWRRHEEMEIKISDVYETYYDELHLPESLHQEQCLNWLLIWCQVSDLDHEFSKFQFVWQNGRLFALNPLAVINTDEVDSPVVTEAALLHFMRGKISYQSGTARTPPGSPPPPPNSAKPTASDHQHRQWRIEVNIGPQMLGMKIRTNTDEPLLHTFGT